jgi:hypothetical protein
MLKHSARFRSFWLALALLSLAGTAEAKKKKAEPPPAEDVKLEDDDSSKKSADDQKPAEDAKPAEEAPAAESEEGEKKEAAPPVAAAADASNSAVEEKGKSYQFVGARFRAVIIPSFVIHLFGDGGKTVFAPNFGPEFAIRRDNFEYNFSLTYTSYVMTDTPFKAKNDPQEAMELVDAHVKVLYAAADFVWSHPFNPNVALLYGGGAGLGIVWGPIYRTQAYPTANGGWAKCPGPPTATTPPTQALYCAPDPTLGDKPQHYPGYQEPNWANGGSKPIVFPWLALQTGLRWKPSHDFVGRLDVGIGFGQFFFGVGADYGL